MSTDKPDPLRSSLDAIFSSLTADPPAMSATDAVERAIALASQYTSDFSLNPSEESKDTPGAERFGWSLWGSVLDVVRTGTSGDQQAEKRIDRLISFVRLLKEKPDVEPGWIVWGAPTSWNQLPLLGPSIREEYNGPFQNFLGFDFPVLYLTPEGQAAMARTLPSLFEADSIPTDQKQKLFNIQCACEGWLLLQTFIAKVWRDVGLDYAIYSIWALRAGLEDLPSPPPAFNDPSMLPSDKKPAWNQYMRSPAYCALEIEAASIWVQLCAPLMYACKEIYGSNGRDDWPDNHGRPGKGGKRWNGVDGFDQGKQRWMLWKQVLQEALQWCDAEASNMVEWKTKNAVQKALRAMSVAEKAAT